MDLDFIMLTFPGKLQQLWKIPFQAFKMCPGWAKTKKHYDRIMEINYRQPQYIVFGKPKHVHHILCTITGGWQGPWPSWILRTIKTKVSLPDWWARGRGVGMSEGVYRIHGVVCGADLPSLKFRLLMISSWCLSLGSLLISWKGEKVRQGVDGAGDHGDGLASSRLRHHRFCNISGVKMQRPARESTFDFSGNTCSSTWLFRKYFSENTLQEILAPSCSTTWQPTQRSRTASTR